MISAFSVFTSVFLASSPFGDLTLRPARDREACSGAVVATRVQPGQASVSPLDASRWFVGVPVRLGWHGSSIDIADSRINAAVTCSVRTCYIDLHFVIGEDLKVDPLAAQKSDELRRLGFSDSEIKDMAKENRPERVEVHHRRSLECGGNNTLKT